MYPNLFRAACLMAVAALLLVPAAPAAMVSFGLDDGFGIVDVNVTLEDTGVDEVTATISVDPLSFLTGDIFAIGFGSTGAAPGIAGPEIWGDYSGAPFPILGLSSIAGVGYIPWVSIFIDEGIDSTEVTLSGVDVLDISLVGVAMNYLGPNVGLNQTLPRLGGHTHYTGCGHTCFECGPKVPPKTFEWGSPDGGPPGGGDEVPEPATVTLMGAGLLGLVYFRRRRK